MLWLNKVVDEVVSAHPDGEIIIESGVSPSGVYHVGTLREVLTCDAILLELRHRGRDAKHIHYVDDLDPLRKVPANIPADFEKYLGRPYCDVPAPDGSNQSYADFFLNDFLGAAKELHMDMEIIRSHKQYRVGVMTEAIEKTLLAIDDIRRIIEQVSGRKLEKDWAPIQVMEDEYLKSRRFVSIDIAAKTVTYLDPEDKEVTISYAKGQVKLNWRVDWPARWWLLHVDVEPFGRDHATKGGSYDTGAAIIKQVFGAAPPVPMPYNFINLTGETKKMSKSSGNIIAISELTKVLPAEVIRYFTLRFPPQKQLFFDTTHGVTKLIDDYAELLAKKDKTDEEKRLIEICSVGQDTTVSLVPFSHLVASYQAALKDTGKTLQVLARTEYKETVEAERELIGKELKFIDSWLGRWAPAEAKFELLEQVSTSNFTGAEKDYLSTLSQKIAGAPAGADGEWFHKAIYELKESRNMSPEQVFTPLYRAVIGQDSGPRAGWFLSILPRDWLIKRLKLEE
ncbi:MAG TPA: lysine--tRNA ligase [Candidatus Saccharimonadales bacterium]|nr:lysine--tRNA ligase [Candidatus Saccharimonadales bacterium]